MDIGELMEETAAGEKAPSDRKIINNAIEGLMLAASFTQDSLPIVIERPDPKTGEPVRALKFVIHPLDETTMRKARKQAMRPNWDESTGKKPVMELDNELFEAYLIYYATDSKDRADLWDNKDAWKKMGVSLATDLIRKVLKPGEKSLIATKISELSGYLGDEDDLVEKAKN